MPKITQFTRTELPTQMLNVKASSASFGGGQGGRRELQGAIDELSQTVQKIQTKRDESEYIRRLSEFKLNELSNRDEFTKREFEHDDDILNAYLGEFSQRSETFLESIPKSQKDRAIVDIENMRLTGGAFAIEDSSRRSIARQISSYEETFANASNIVSLDPERFDEAADLVARSVSQINDPVKRQTLAKEAISTLKIQKAAALYARDPSMFKKAYNDGEFKGADVSKFLEDIDQKIVEHNDAIKQKEFEAQLITELTNEDQILADVASGATTIGRIKADIRKAEILGTVSDGFSSDVIAYLGALESAEISPSSITPEQKIRAFEEAERALQTFKIRSGGSVTDFPENMKATGETISAYREYRSKIYSLVGNGLTPEKANTFISGARERVNSAIEDSKTGVSFLSKARRGVQDHQTEALKAIDNLLENSNRKGDVGLKSDLFFMYEDFLGKFNDKDQYVVTGEYESTGSTPRDEKIIRHAVREAAKAINAKNFVGQIDESSPPNKIVQPVQEVRPEHIFSSESEMEESLGPEDDGTPVIVNGVRGNYRR